MGFSQFLKHTHVLADNGLTISRQEKLEQRYVWILLNCVCETCYIPATVPSRMLGDRAIQEDHLGVQLGYYWLLHNSWSFRVSAKPVSCQAYRACSQSHLNRSKSQPVITAYRQRVWVAVPVAPGSCLSPQLGILSVLHQYLNYVSLKRAKEFWRLCSACETFLFLCPQVATIDF